MAGREWKDVAPPLVVRVFQWNVLADSCATDDAQGFPYVPAEALDTALRRPMQLKEILADDADVLALQEVDSPHEFEKALEEKGYNVLYNKREDSPLGVLVAYKADKYTVGVKNMITFTNGGQVAIILLLEDKAVGRSFVFATAHLKAKSDEKSKQMRKRQSEELLVYVKNMSDDWEGRTFSYNSRAAEMKGNIILAGDLNDDSHRPPIKTWTDLDGFGRAYGYDLTTFKVRKTSAGWKESKCCTEDHIIHNGTIARERTLPQDFKEPFLPSKDFPSDHLSLCVDIVFVN